MADHFFNFCVTAQAMRDYFFELKGIVGRSQKAPYHQHWDKNPALVAVADIANTTKHFTLRLPGGAPRSPGTRGVRTGRATVMDVYRSSRGFHVLPRSAPAVIVTLSDGTRHEMWQLTEAVERYWRQYLGRNGVRIRRQPFRHLSGSR